MRLHFLSTSVLNSKVIDTATQDVLYEVVSKGISGPSDFQMRTMVSDVKKDGVYAKWERMHNPERGDDWFSHRSSTRSSDGVLSDWLPDLVQFSPPTQRFVAPNKDEYVWERHDSKKGFKLVKPDSGEVIAKSKRASGLSLGRGRPGVSLDVQPQAEPFLELVVMTFVILEQVRWEQEVTTVQTSDFDDMLSTLSRRLGISKWARSDNSPAQA